MCEPLWWQTLGGVWFHGPLLNVNILKMGKCKIQKEMVEQQEIILEHLTEVETLRKAMVALSTFQNYQSIPAILKI